jgi:hypothetical protein
MEVPMLDPHPFDAVARLADGVRIERRQAPV